MWFLRVLLAMCPLRKMLHLDNKSSFMAQNYSSMPCFFSSASLPVSQRNNGTSCHLGNFLDEASTVIEFELFLKATKFNWREEKNWIGSYSVLHSRFFFHFEVFSWKSFKTEKPSVEASMSVSHSTFVGTAFLSTSFCEHWLRKQCFL